MQFTTKPFITKPFIDAPVIQQRLETLVEQMRDSFPAMSSGVTLVSVTESSKRLVEQFATIIRRYEIDVVLLEAEDFPRAQWLIDNDHQWLESCILIQDVSSTGEQIQELSTFCADHLAIPVRTVIVLSKPNDDVDSSMWEPDWVGFHIPNEYVVGCGMGVHEKLQTLSSIQVLA